MRVTQLKNQGEHSLDFFFAAIDPILVPLIDNAAADFHCVIEFRIPDAFLEAMIEKLLIDLSI